MGGQARQRVVLVGSGTDEKTGNSEASGGQGGWGRPDSGWCTAGTETVNISSQSVCSVSLIFRVTEAAEPVEVDAEMLLAFGLMMRQGPSEIESCAGGFRLSSDERRVSRRRFSAGL